MKIPNLPAALTVLSMFFLHAASAQIASMEGAWQVDRSDEKKLHENLDGFIAGILSRVEFATEEDKAAAPGKIFSAFAGQKFWFRKSADQWEQEHEMNGQRTKITVSIAPTEQENQFRITKDGKPTFLVTLISDEKITLTSINDKISFPLVRQEPDKSATEKPSEKDGAPSNP